MTTSTIELDVDAAPIELRDLHAARARLREVAAAHEQARLALIKTFATARRAGLVDSTPESSRKEFSVRSRAVPRQGLEP